ncbi:MAG: TIGR01777 family oxidoreductase [Pseudomonadota bacterium]
MNILITGGTGLIGRQLCKALLAEGNQLTVLSRHPETVAEKCGLEVEAFATLEDWKPDRVFDAIINLAGEPIVDAYWSAKRKQVLWDSRVTLTEKLVQRIAAAKQKPKVLLSGSAVGFYGNRGDTELAESAVMGNDFAARLCNAWEQAALGAEIRGVRVCLLRTGLVLSTQGGILGRMLLPFKLGLGARLGDGKQWMSWVHIQDYVAIVKLLLDNGRLHGSFNMTAPNPVSNAQFTQTLAHSLHRPVFFAAPGIALKWAMGARSALLLEGQRVLPKNIEAAGYNFIFSDLEGALKDLLG